MALTPTFISFDYDHDDDLRTMLVGQAKNTDSPFWIADYSVKEAMTGDWKAKVRTRMKRASVAAVICGQYTHTATGVAEEVSIAQEEGISYFLLWGRSGKTCYKPSTARAGDQIYEWTWDNLKKLIGGSR